MLEYNAKAESQDSALAFLKTVSLIKTEIDHIVR